MSKPAAAPGIPNALEASPAALLAIFKKQRDDELAKERAAKPDLWTGKRVCHRFMIPSSYLSPKPGVKSLDPKAVEVQLNLQMGYTQCQGPSCGRWNAEDKECADMTDTINRRRIADTLDMMDGLARVQAAAGGNE